MNLIGCNGEGHEVFISDKALNFCKTHDINVEEICDTEGGRCENELLTYAGCNTLESLKHIFKLRESINKKLENSCLTLNDLRFLFSGMRDYIEVVKNMDHHNVDMLSIINMSKDLVVNWFKYQIGSFKNIEKLAEIYKHIMNYEMNNFDYLYDL